jgi:TolA-binding protein
MKKIYFSLIVLASVFTACNTHKDKDLFDSAELKNESKNYSQALKEYESVIEGYPESEYAAKCLMKIASMYQMFVIPNISNQESSKQAVNYYRKMYQKFPANKETPKALFLCGFLLANEVKNYEEAKIAYQTFLDKFPKNELVSQVKLELENLGKSPEEILESKIAGK